MIIVFTQPYLRELFETGCTSDKKHRFQPEIISRYQSRIRILRNVTRPEALYKINSLHFEALSGDKAGKYSVRINRKYRIEFTLSGKENVMDSPEIIICNIEEISNHYD